MDLAGIVDDAELARLQRARGGEAVERILRLGDAAPGDVGVVEATVRATGTRRSFTRRQGGTGQLARITLADPTGEADLVLWDAETALAADPRFQPGRRLLLRGASVREGMRGGIELALAGGQVDAVAEPQAWAAVEGTLVGLGPARLVPARPRPLLQADAELETPSGRLRLTLTGAAFERAHATPAGSRVRLDGVAPHPLLAGWLLAGPGLALSPATPPADTPK